MNTALPLMDISRPRLLAGALLFCLLFGGLGWRVVDLAVDSGVREPAMAGEPLALPFVSGRADIRDRNGNLIATSLPAASLFVNARDFRIAREDPAEATRRLVAIFPDLDAARTTERLSSDRPFVYLRRGLTPVEQDMVNRLGIAGLNFQREHIRVYPQGALFSHVIGLTDVDGNGVAGVEKMFDSSLRAGGGVQLSLDMAIQDMVRVELAAAIEKFDAVGGVGIVQKVKTGEVLAMVSLPEFDPNKGAGEGGAFTFNQATLGVYELGSIFKIFNTAMALDSHRVRPDQRFDVREPIKISRFKIEDFHAFNGAMTPAEILVHSSNIGSAKMAMELGGKTQKTYLRNFGLLDPLKLEMPETGKPLYPKHWRDINTMTISYGHGISVSPLHATTALAGLLNDGILHPATIIKQDRQRQAGRRIIGEETARLLRQMMRLVVTRGTGGNADVPGYLVGGKTGTAEKPGRKAYKENKLISSFIAGFPMDDPEYVVLVSVDEPKGREDTHGYATGGWVAAPVVKAIISGLGSRAALANNRKDMIFNKGHPLFIPPDNG